jgi:predicted acetyltransferase
MSEIRRLTESDLEQAAVVGANAYPGFGIRSEEGRKRFRERLLVEMKEEPRMEPFGLFGAGGRLYGMMKLYDYQMTVLTQQVPVAGVGFVAVDLMHKKEHVCRDMMRFFLTRCRERCAPLAILYPFRPDFYKSMGFGYGTRINQYRVKAESLPDGRDKSHIRFASQADGPALRDFCNRYALKTHGHCQKNSFEIRRYLGPEPAVVYEKDGEIRGYVFYTFKTGPGDNPLIHDLVVRELVCEDEALPEMFAFLRSQLDQVDRLIFNVFDDEFFAALADPRNGTDHFMTPVYHETNTQGLGLMYRVTDTAALFGRLADHSFGDKDFVLRLSVQDTFFVENNGPVVVRFESGRPRLLDSSACADVEVSIGVAELSSLIMGVVSLGTLLRYGLAHISDARLAPKVEAAFRTKAPPQCTTQF